MEARARLVNYRVSARKARLIADQIRGKGVEEALNLLDLSDKRFAHPLAKLVRSALANAEQSNERDSAGIDIDNLVIGKILVDRVWCTARFVRSHLWLLRGVLAPQRIWTICTLTSTTRMS